MTKQELLRQIRFLEEELDRVNEISVTKVNTIKNLEKENKNLKSSLHKIQSKFLKLPENGIIRKELVTSVTNVYEDGKYTIIINTTIENLTKVYTYDKDKKEMNEKYLQIIEQLV